MATSFRPHPNNVSTALASNYTAGSGSLVLASGTGAAFGSTFPLTVTVAQAANVGLTTEVNTIFTVTGRTSDTLTGVSATEGSTDRAYAIGDRCEARWTGGLATAIETAVNGVENSTGITSGVIAPARLGTNTPTNCNWLRGDGAWQPNFIILNVTGNTALSSAGNNWIMADATASAITITLPSAAAVGGAELLIMKKDGSANQVTIQRAGTDLFPGGGTTIALAAGGKFYRLVSGGGSLWFVIGSN